MTARPAIILVSPMGALNVGGIARLMGNFGFHDLRIVQPRCKLESLECKQMSMQSYEIIQKAKIFSTLEEAQSELTLSIAFSARPVEDERPHSPFPEWMQKHSSLFRSSHRIGLVFGREETGLRLEELALCDWQISLPTTEEKPSINLTSATAIVLSQLFFSVFQDENMHEKTPTLLFERPTKQKEALLFERTIKMLWETKFSNPQNPTQVIPDLRSIYHRANPSERDLRILFGILAAIEESLQRARRSAS